MLAKLRLLARATVAGWLLTANPAAAQMLGLSAAQWAHALGIAATQAAGLLASGGTATLLTARLLGEADYVFHDSNIPGAILNRARADAIRHEGTPPTPAPEGLVLYLRLPSASG